MTTLNALTICAKALRNDGKNQEEILYIFLALYHSDQPSTLAEVGTMLGKLFKSPACRPQDEPEGPDPE